MSVQMFRKTTYFCTTLLIFLFSTIASASENAHVTVHYAESAKITKSAVKGNANAMRISLVTNGFDATLELEKNQSFNLKAREFEVDSSVVYYKGKLENNESSWARFTDTNGQLTGAFYDGTDLYFVDLASQVADVMSDAASRTVGRSKPRQLLLIRADDMGHNGTCSAEGHSKAITGAQSYKKLSQELAAIAAVVPRELDVELVADTEWNADFNGNGAAQMLSEMNIVDGIFSSQLGLSMNIVGSRVLADNGNLTSTNASTLLGNFRAYVGSEIGNPGLTHLFTGKDLDGSTIGIAYLSTVCGRFGVGVTQRFSNLTALVAAHEFAHNLGSPHDNENGSACASTPGSFLMNPGINGSDDFSQCSIDQMLPLIETASCIVETTGVGPEITSTAALTAEVGQLYRYNDDNQVVATGDNLTFNLDIAPDGMTLSDSGAISWVPSPGQQGTQSVQITVTNAGGSDTQIFDISVTTPFVTFDSVPVESYGGNQDVTGTFDISADANRITLTGNTWKRIPFNYTVTANTAIELVFSSGREGEIQGFGVDDDNVISPDRTFNLYGTQNWGITSSRYTGSGDEQTFVLPIGQHMTGRINYLVFVNDDDVPSPRSESQISSIRVYENVTSPDVDFNTTGPVPYTANQDGEGSVTITEAGFGLELEGNRWQKISLPVTITRQSVLSFEFRSINQGEIHGIGFGTDDNLNAGRAFRLYGTQNWGIADFANYSGNGAFQRYTIPVGEYYTGDQLILFFINDHDVASPTGHSEFRNIQIRD